MEDSRYRNSTQYLERAQISIPIGSQTFSKSRTQYPVGFSPLFIERAKGPFVWDIDKNKYIDLVNSLAAITIGYNDKQINKAVKKQMQKGIIFSLPGKLETEVAELIIATVPSAEMVRFAKTGTDATSGAVRLARAYTGRDEIIFCGYHGWQDWYIGSTTKNKGVPNQVSELTHKFIYNDISSLKQIFESRVGKIAAVIMEPINYEYPVNNFLEEVQKLTQLNGSILIFDETITGYRISRGGAQEEFKVIPDITTLGKGIANGYPLSAIVGRKEIMLEMENIFFSGTFGGELLSLAAAKAVISMHMESDISAQLASIGSAISNGIEKIVRENKMENLLKLSGHPSWKFLNWSQSNGFNEKIIKTFFMQEMLKRGILVLSTHNVSLSIKEKHIQRILNTYGEVLSIVNKSIVNETIMDKLKATPIETLFKIR